MKTFLFWTLAVLIAAIVGCKDRGSPVSPSLDCRAKLLKPYVTALASDLVDAARKGEALPEAAVKSLQESGVSLEEVQALVKAWERCATE